MAAVRRILHATDFSPASRPASRAAVRLARRSRERADVITMGTRGPGGLNRALLGSVTDRVIRLATCPVLTVRETE